jgi:hypothetical protein
MSRIGPRADAGITIDPVSGMRVGGADPRSDGAAIGY